MDAADLLVKPRITKPPESTKEQAVKTKHTFHEDTDKLSYDGIQAVCKYLRDSHVGLIFLAMYDGTIDWTTQLTSEGRLTTRLSKYLSQKWDTKLSSKAKSQIGNIVNDHKVPTEDYAFEFCPDIVGMTSGIFGDDGSCFYSENKEARSLMQVNDFHVIKVYTLPDEEPYARAWCKWLNDESFVMFNGYHLQTRTIANMAAKTLDVKLIPIKLTNQGSDCNLLWINNAKGYLLGDNELITAQSNGNSRPHYDFNIEHERYCECRFCSPNNED